ncbi:MAG: hypothetical protein U9R15_20840 [Chloroflexota bacterium]|nr:hypothetical protein [Chloroflexota bacterium]
MMRETWVHASRTQQIQCRIGPAGRPEALLRDPGPRSILKVVTSRCGWGRRSHRPPGQVAGGAQVGQQARDEDGDGEAGKSPL